MPFLPGAFWDALGLRDRGASAPARPRRRSAADVLVTLAFALVLAENAASTLRTRGGPDLPRPLASVVEALGLSQQWRLWDRPIPDRYHVFAATLRDGSQVDLHTGAPLDWDRPRRRSANNHWWKYHLNLARGYAAPLRPWYARYLARSWEREHAPPRAVDRLELVRIQAIERGVPLSQQPREVLWRGAPPA